MAVALPAEMAVALPAETAVALRPSGKFEGTNEPPVTEPKRFTGSKEDSEEHFKYRWQAETITNFTGFTGPDAKDRLWATWKKYGALEAESPEQQRARYDTVDPESEERNPGLARHMLRNPEIVAVTGLDYLIRTFDAKTFKKLQIFEGHLNAVSCVFQYHGKWLVSASLDSTVRKWRLGTKERTVKPEKTFYLDIWCIRSMCLLPGHRAAISQADATIAIISLHTGEYLFRNDDHYQMGPYDGYWQTEGCGNVYALLHIRDNLFMSASDDMTIRIWNCDTMKCYGIHIGHHGYGKEIGVKWHFTQRWAPVWTMIHLGGGGTRFASGSYDRTIGIWDVADVEDVKFIKHLGSREDRHDNAILYLALLEENVIMSCSADHCFKVWNIETEEVLQRFETRGIAMCCMRLTSNCAAVGGGDHTIRVIDWREGEDLIGDRGFYAADSGIHWMAPIYVADMERDESEWMEPIMYRDRDPFEMCEKYKEGREFFPKLVTQAKDFSRYGEWGESFANPEHRFGPRTMDYMLPEEPREGPDGPEGGELGELPVPMRPQKEMHP